MDSKGQNQCTLKGIFGGKTQKFEQIWKPAPIYICPICQNSVLDSDIQYICKYEGKNRYVEVSLIKMKVELYTYISYSCS